MAVGDLYRLAIVGVGQQTQELVNVHYYEARTSDPDDKGTGLIDAWAATVSAAMAACISDQILIVRLEARNVDQPTQGQDYSLSPAIAGDLTGETLPPIVSARIRWTTGLIGRRTRGATSMWPTTEGSQNAGQWNAGYLSALDGYAAASITLDDPGSTAVYHKMVYSTAARDSAGVLLPPARYEISGYVIDVLTSSQDKRKPGRGS